MIVRARWIELSELDVNIWRRSRIIFGIALGEADPPRF